LDQSTGYALINYAHNVILTRKMNKEEMDHRNLLTNLSYRSRASFSEFGSKSFQAIVKTQLLLFSNVNISVCSDVSCVCAGTSHGT
jgi:hypothetical protein